MSDDIEKCPECGFPIKPKANTMVTAPTLEMAKPRKIVLKPVHKRIIGVALIVVSLILIIVGIVQVTNDRYNFYKEHYQECLDGYNDCMREARNSSGWFSSSYKSIADSYTRMMNEDNAEIWKYRITAIVCGCISITSFVIGIRFITRKE